MARSTHRAPAGSVALGAQVKALTSQLGSKATANMLGVSPASINRMLKAVNSRNMSKAFTTGRALTSWAARVTAAKSMLPREAARAVDRRKRPGPLATPAPTRDGRKQQDIAAAVKSQYRDRDLAKALGVSRQKATAMRLAAERGTAPKETTQALTEARNKLEERGAYTKDGIKVISQEQANALLLRPGVESRGKGFPDWKSVTEWFEGVLGGKEQGSTFARVVNRGTAANPSYDILVSENSDDVLDDSVPDDPYDNWDYGDDPEDYGDMQDE